MDKKIPLTKKQKLLIALSGIIFILFSGFGMSLPWTHPFNLFIYGLTMFAILLFLYMCFKPVYCPKCHTKLPTMRKPENKREALFGGWTCKKCHLRVDADGKPLSKKHS